MSHDSSDSCAKVKLFLHEQHPGTPSVFTAHCLTERGPRPQQFHKHIFFSDVVVSISF